ncbi:MAG: RsmG family class I SAM-dependent methyltransferase [Balneolaceae bacterium]
MKHFIKTHAVSHEILENTEAAYLQSKDLLEAYLSELLWWNKKINLVSRGVSRETLRAHVRHSLLPSALSLLNGTDYWIDAGTGGGLPGVPLAITEPDKRWILNDISAKKMAAVKQIIHKLALGNASGEAKSLESMKIAGGMGVISKHAFSVQGLMSMVDGKPWEKIIFYKGADEAENEIKKLPYPVSCTIYRLEFGKKAPFYQGKGIVVIRQLL